MYNKFIPPAVCVVKRWLCSFHSSWMGTKVSIPSPALVGAEAIITRRHAEVKLEVSSLATSGVTTLAMLALIPMDAASRCLLHIYFHFTQSDLQ